MKLKYAAKVKKKKLRIIFHKDINSKDGLHKQCKSCRKQYYNQNLVKIEKNI